jgi:2-polyprenyl-3-methyl-5-hydroxy-6-metoxy-1,4-benzoquinol methylase
MKGTSLAGTSLTRERIEDDFYATDPKSLELLLDELEKDNIKLNKYIWECACGQGHLSEVLKNRGYSVYSTDLIDTG